MNTVRSVPISALVADQAVFTSMNRRGGMSGYHLVSRSPGLTEGEAREIATTAPSHDSLIVDPINTVSVNFQYLASQRYALSRTCQGRPEYSGRGGRQLYTHFLVFSADVLRFVRFQVFHLYRDALTRGLLHYRPLPPQTLPRVRFSCLYPMPDAAFWEDRARSLGMSDAHRLAREIRAVRRPLVVPFAGNRFDLVECLLGMLDGPLVGSLSFSTSLKPSTVRPYRLCVVGEP